MVLLGFSSESSDTLSNIQSCAKNVLPAWFCMTICGILIFALAITIRSKYHNLTYEGPEGHAKNPNCLGRYETLCMRSCECFYCKPDLVNGSQFFTSYCADWDDKFIKDCAGEVTSIREDVICEDILQYDLISDILDKMFNIYAGLSCAILIVLVIIISCNASTQNTNIASLQPWSNLLVSTNRG